MKCRNALGATLCLILLMVAAVPVIAQDDPNPNCTIIVPDAPLTATGLATPYLLLGSNGGGPCNETNDAQSAFVQAAILDPATGQISIYNPLVIDQGSAPAVNPITPVLPDNAVVALWFGFNGDTLTLQGASDTALQAGACVNGVGDSNFGQFAYCNAPAFFKAAHRAIRFGKLHIPRLGFAADGRPCPTVRDFFVVDQDQSDNLPVTYLISADNTLAQKTQLNIGALPGAATLGNPSDEGLVDRFLDPDLGCTPWKAPDLADPGQTVAALPLNELQAWAYQRSPVALVPKGDPMVLNDDSIDLVKLNAYRLGVDQPPVRYGWQADTARYCRQMVRIAPAKLLLDRPFLIPDAAHPARGLSPDPGAADSMFTFLAQRFAASYDILGCADLLHMADPISVQTDANGVVNKATINVPFYNRCKQYLAPFQRQDDAADDAAKAAAATQ